ncbi:MAG: hypothetical protein DRH79_08605 [Candidatus Cloacimonadota bacterium]|nr:MAG: hypothetical protein DRH79_08605 [Candidatus Cloacimonadota bacterium]
MKDSVHKVLSKLGWLIFFFFIFLNLVNWAFIIKDDFFIKRLPFRLEEGSAVGVQDSTLAAILEDKKIVRIDTLDITRFEDSQNETNGPQLLIFHSNTEDEEAEDLESAIDEVIKNKQTVEITCQDSLGRTLYTVDTISRKDYSSFITIAFNALFLLFIFFNSYLLLRYSQAQENILIVLFLLLLASPNDIAGMSDFNIIITSSAAILGILFYHFVQEKLGNSYNIKILYFISIGLIIIGTILHLVFQFSANLVYYAWSIIWLLVSFKILWKAYKASKSMDLKRLLNAFKGLFLAIVALLIAFLFGGILYFTSSGQTEFGIYNLQMGFLIGFILLAMLVFIIGILWFFGAFTWSLLTGTALGVKIRSTMIYTIVGVTFVVFFGLLDYSLGELLQKLFGRFVGSEFIAGIPATIGLLMFLNPVRQKVERMVDNRLNTSDLDFLEKTDSFTDVIAGEGVIEGFEEFICENLTQRLPIKKVALISYNLDKKAYIFNEIRGSDVEENSIVEDVHLTLLENKLTRNYGALNENEQEIGSFSIVVPIIYDLDHKWFLALGKKLDGTSYSRKDEEALKKLAAKIKLSLKFILAYEHIINNRYVDSLEEKDKMIARLQKQIADLAIKLNEKNISIEES